MQISKKTQYGLRAMIFLAKKDGRYFFSLKDISKNEDIPFDFLEKIMSLLEREKLVKAKKGVSGGYALAKKPSKVSVKDIVRALERTKAVDCSFCGKAKKCASKNVWGKVDLAIEKTLKSITLKSLIK